MKDDPTPSEIAERCRQVHREWTPAERQRRMRVDWRSNQRVEIRTASPGRPEHEHIE